LDLDPTLLTIGSLLSFGLFLTLAYVAEQERLLRWLVYALAVVGDLGVAFVGAAFLLLAVLQGGQVELAPGCQLPEAAVASMGRAYLGLGLVGLLALVPLVRRFLARVVPFDPARLVHAVALQYAVQLLVVSVAIGIVISAALLPGCEALLRRLTEETARGGLAMVWLQNLAFVVIGLLGVGFGVRRGWRASLERLGLTREFRFGWWAGMTALGLAGGYVTSILWTQLAPQSQADVERISQALFEPFIALGLVGALTIGLAAGIGEEILFRGAAQPRLGLVFTSLLFAALHTQYTVSPALLQVLFLGLLLGLTRQRVNTTTAVAVHAAYNFLLVALAYYAPQLSP